MTTQDHSFRERTKLSASAITLLHKVNASLNLFSELTQCPLFIDLIEDETGLAYVYAEAHPREQDALYKWTVAGSYALPENEPAVYRALEMGLPVRDTKAVTQEAQVVLQNVLPLRDDKGIVFAVLIMERNITRDVQREEKMHTMASVIGQLSEFSQPTDTEALFYRESIHRVKNHLQLLVSLARLRAREASSPESIVLLNEYADSLLTVATLYDNVNSTIGRDELDIVRFLTELSNKLTAVLEGKVSIDVRGEPLIVNGEKARILGIIANELIQNSIRHGKQDDKLLHITINVDRGNWYNVLTVEDNGRGLDGRPLEKGLGLTIIDRLLGSSQEDALELIDTGTGVKTVLRFKP